MCQDQAQVGVGFGQVDAGASLEGDVVRHGHQPGVGRSVEVVAAVHVGAGERRAAEGVDVQVLADRADGAAMSVDIDGLAQQVRGGIAQAVDDGAGPAAQGHVAGAERIVAGGLHDADTQVSRYLVQVDTEGLVVVSREVMCVQKAQRAAHRVDLDLEEVVREADAADARDAACCAEPVVAGGQGDVAAGDVDGGLHRSIDVQIVGVNEGGVIVRVQDAGVELGVEDLARGVEGDVRTDKASRCRADAGRAGAEAGCMDVADAEIALAALLDHPDVAVVQDVDLARVVNHAVRGRGLVISPRGVDVGERLDGDLRRR